MEIYTVNIPYAEVIRIIPFGDWHVGNINCDRKRLEEFIDWIARENDIFWVGMGDYVDDVAPIMGENRFFSVTIDPEVFQYAADNGITPTVAQHEIVRGYFNRIRDKCIGLHVGNHEISYMQRTDGENFVKEYCEDNGLNYLGYNALTKVNIVKKGAKKPVMDFVVCSTHGSTAARKAGTRLNAIDNWTPSYEADIFLMGHTHEATAHRTIRLWTDGKRLHESKKVYALTGGFLKGYQQGTFSYVERKNLPPNKIGVVKISVYPDRWDIHAEA